MEFAFTVEIEPRGKARPRFDPRTRRAFTPSTTVEYEWQIREAFRSAYPDAEPLTGDLSVKIGAHFKVPKSWSLKKQDKAIGTPCRKKPDCDNIAKAALDALNGFAYWDDAQVTELTVTKTWARKNGLLILISEVRNE